MAGDAIKRMNMKNTANSEVAVSRQVRLKRRHHKRGGLVISAVILVIIVFSGLLIWHANQQSVLKAYPVKGVSVTQDDGYLDFHQLQGAGIKFVYLRSTSGASYLDDDFLSNYQRAAGTTLQVGIYQEFSFDKSAQQQYQYMVSQIGQQSGNLPIAIHVAYYDKYDADNMDYAKQGARLATLVNLLSERYGQGCIVWAAPQLQKKMVDPYVGDVKRWTVLSKLKRQNPRVKFMQYTGHEEIKVAGKRSDLTVSVFNGSKKEWKEEVN